MTAHQIAGALALLGALAMNSPADAAPATARLADSAWAGDQLQLVVHGQGAHLETGCASGDIEGPLMVAADGRFTARGTFQLQRGGPQRADSQPALRPAARYTGEVKEGVMRLEILPDGAASPEVFTLHKGARIKLIRCL